MKQANSRGDVPSDYGVVDVFCLVKTTSAQSIPNNTLTTVTFHQAIEDTLGMWDGATKITMPAVLRGDALNLCIIGFGNWAANATGRRRNQIRINGTDTLMPQHYMRAPATDIAAIPGWAMMNKIIYPAPHWVLGSTYFEFRVLQTSGAALNLDANSIFLVSAIPL